MPTKLKLNSIKIDGGTQPRCQINTDTVSEYAEAIKSGVTLPPITVFFDGSNHWLGDGFHRLFAHQEAGLEEIECNVERGLLRAAILHSVGANHSHGLRRTNADKRRAVETLLKDKEWGAWSTTKIAEACRVSDELVKSVKASHLPKTDSEKPESAKSIPGGEKLDKPENQPRMYRTKHGTVAVMNTANIGKKKPANEPIEEQDSPATDDYDQIIPEHLLPAFDNSDTIAVLSRKVASLKGDVEAAGSAPGGELLAANKSEIERLRKDLYGLLADNRPTAVCGMCHGDKKKAKDCKACKGRGWLPDHVYKALPEANRKGGKHAPQTVSAASG